MKSAFYFLDNFKPTVFKSNTNQKWIAIRITFKEIADLKKDVFFNYAMLAFIPCKVSHFCFKYI